MTKNSLASPRKEALDPLMEPAETLADAGIGGATGRAERTVITIEGSECVYLLQPVNVFPVHSSQAVFGGILMLFAMNSPIARDGPEIDRSAPLKRARL
jgi:hypothetical protein